MEMEIIDIKHHDVEILINKLKQVTLMSYPDIKIYKDSNVRLEINNEQNETLYPCQYYLSKDELIKIRNLNYSLKTHDIDMFQLDGYVTLSVKYPNVGGVFEIDLLPPIVEGSTMSNGNFNWLICDGMHRIYLSMLEHCDIQIVVIGGNSSTLNKYPYYAYPIPNMMNPGCPAWHEVKIYDTVPKDMIKRWPRIQNHKSLYRDFNSVFSGVSGRTTHRLIKEKE